MLAYRAAADEPTSPARTTGSSLVPPYTGASIDFVNTAASTIRVSQSTVTTSWGGGTLN